MRWHTWASNGGGDSSINLENAVNCTCAGGSVFFSLSQGDRSPEIIIGRKGEEEDLEEDR